MITACSSFHGVKPIFPGLSLGPPKNIQTLQPTLQWEPSSDLNSSYDIIVYEAIQVQELPGGGYVNQEKLRKAYYREGIKDTKHEMEEPLKRGTKYYWTVRVRHGQEVSDWSSYDPPFSLLGDGGEKLLFAFWTPD